MRNPPEYVYVVRQAVDQYTIYQPSGDTPLYTGNAEQVHTWLGQHDYKRTRFSPGSWLAGDFKRTVKEVA